MERELFEISHEDLLKNLAEVNQGVYTLENEKEDIDWFRNQTDLKFYGVFISSGSHIETIFVIKSNWDNTPEYKHSVQWWVMACDSWHLDDPIPTGIGHRMWGEWTRQRYLLIDKCTGYDFDKFIPEMTRDLKLLQDALTLYGCDVKQY